MSEVKLSNVPSMPVGTMVTKLSDAYSKLIENGLSVWTMPSVMLWGPPGYTIALLGVGSFDIRTSSSRGKRYKVIPLIKD